MERYRPSENPTRSIASLTLARNKRSERAEFLPNVDGRTHLARRWQQHATDIISDQGGSDNVSTARLVLCKRLAAITAMVEDIEAAHVRGESIDINAYLSMVQVATRLANTIGLNRRTKKVLSPQEYLASQTIEHDDGEDDDD